MLLEYILIPTDLSEQSTTSFEVALYEAKSKNAKIVLAHIIEDPARTEVECEEELKKIAKGPFHRKEITYMTKRLNRSVQEDIIELIDEIPAQLVVLSSHGSSEDPSRPMGHVTEAIIDKAFCPVLVVPMIKDDEDDL